MKTPSALQTAETERPKKFPSFHPFCGQVLLND